MTTVYLALGGTLKAIATGFSEPPAAAALCSFVYYDIFEPLLQQGEHVRKWCLDSGAYTAWSMGKEVKLDDYIAFCRRAQTFTRPPEEVFALDVIGDWKASLKNTEEMWKAGIPAIPCYHAGEPEHVLISMAREYPKIAVGGTVGRLYASTRQRFLEQCFARVWPKKIHGFGVATQETLQALPFHSADASSWEIGPLRYGNWAAYKLPVAGPRKNFDLRPEVRVFLNLESRLQNRWRREMAQLDALPLVVPSFAP